MAGCRLGQVTPHLAPMSAVMQTTLAGWWSKPLPTGQNCNYIPYMCNLFSAEESSLTFPGCALYYFNVECVVQLAEHCIFF